MFSLLTIFITFLVLAFTNPSLLKQDGTTASLVPIGTPTIIENYKPEPPHLKEGAESLELEAKAAIVLDRQTGKILYKKNIDERLAIASLTKLMTALVVIENTNLTKVAIVSKEAVETEGNRIDLWSQETISVKNLLYALLISSSNDAAVALAEHFGKSRTEVRYYGNSELQFAPFVELMNKRVKNLGLKNTHFSNPTGLDDPENFSTAYDLAKITSFLLDRPLIFEILRIPRMKIYSADGRINHLLLNTNKLLGKLPNIVGGKTGFTEEARETMILVVKKLYKDHQIISVILGSEDKFEETEKLVKWVLESYKW